MSWRLRRTALLGVVLLAAACSLGAQSKNPDDLAVGKILVAPKDSGDPLFAKSVILLVHYDKTGALGLMINHPTTVPISQALKGLQAAGAHSDPVFVGGPVEMDAVFALVRAAAKPDGTAAVVSHVFFASTKESLLKELAGSSNPSQLRIYIGYCGWGARQLDGEVGDGRWFIFNGSQALAFDSNPSTLWSRLIAKTEEQFVLLRFPFPFR